MKKCSNGFIRKGKIFKSIRTRKVSWKGQLTRQDCLLKAAIDGMVSSISKTGCTEGVQNLAFN